MAAGLVDFRITGRKDIYRDAPQQSSAESYGSYGITFQARKPADKSEWQAAMERVRGEVPEWDEFLDV